MTAIITPSSRIRPECRTFIERLRGRLAKDTGFAALLRRAVGTPLDDSRMLADWYGFLHNAHAPAEFRDGPAAEAAFLVATLFSYDRKAYRTDRAEAFSDADEAPGVNADAPQEDRISENRAAAASDGPRRGNLGSTLGALVEAPRPEEDAMARRLALVLDSSLDEAGTGNLPWRLRRVVKLALSKDARIDWPRLFDDVLDWNKPSSRVQREWAQAFYRTVTAPTEEPDVAVGSAPEET